MSTDEADKLSYDPTGTQLILPLKKQKPVVINPIQTVLDILRKDTISWNWTVPIVKLSHKDIYDLSRRPPNWSDMDPYSGLEDENNEMSNTPDETNNTVIVVPEADTLLKHNKLSPSANSSENNSTPVVASNRYQLREWKPSGSTLNIRSSDRSRSKPCVNYTDPSDDDSDYEPKPKHIRNPNVGLREPSSQ